MNDLIISNLRIRVPNGSYTKTMVPTTIPTEESGGDRLSDEPHGRARDALNGTDMISWRERAKG